MEFNYGTEKKKFDAAWKELAVTYSEAGMPPEAIQEMYDYDWSRFKAARIEAIHTQELTLPIDMDDESEVPESPLMERFGDQLTNQYYTFGGHSRYWWIDELSTHCLTIGIPLLTQEDNELLTMFIIEEMSLHEIAARLNTNKMNISRRLRKLFSYFQ